MRENEKREKAEVALRCKMKRVLPCHLALEKKQMTYNYMWGWRFLLHVLVGGSKNLNLNKTSLGELVVSILTRLHKT